MTDNSRLEELSLDDMSQVAGGINSGARWDMSGGPKWFAGNVGK